MSIPVDADDRRNWSSKLLEPQPERARRSRATIAWYTALIFTASIALGVGSMIIASILLESDPIDNVHISACDPVDFIDGICQGPIPDPDGPNNSGIALTPDLAIPVTGLVCTIEEAGYDVTVSWVPVDGSASFPVIDVPIMWPTGCNDPYNIMWAPPPQLLTIADASEPGDDLGLWRIVGRAVPANDNLYSEYLWDSVRTFRLLVPEE